MQSTNELRSLVAMKKLGSFSQTLLKIVQLRLKFKLLDKCVVGHFKNNDIGKKIVENIFPELKTSPSSK